MVTAGYQTIQRIDKKKINTKEPEPRPSQVDGRALVIYAKRAAPARDTGNQISL
jgi:hypothetical protein